MECGHRADRRSDCTLYAHSLLGAHPFRPRQTYHVPASVSTPRKNRKATRSDRVALRERLALALPTNPTTVPRVWKKQGRMTVIHRVAAGREYRKRNLGTLGGNMHPGGTARHAGTFVPLACYPVSGIRCSVLCWSVPGVWALPRLAFPVQQDKDISPGPSRATPNRVTRITSKRLDSPVPTPDNPVRG